MGKNMKKLLSYTLGIILAMGLGLSYAYAVGANDSNAFVTNTEWEAKVTQIETSIDNVKKTISDTNMDFVMNGPRLQTSVVDGTWNCGSVQSTDNAGFGSMPWHNTTVTDLGNLYSRFNDLRPIGDYIIWYISQNLDLLSKDKKYICDELLDNLLDYADEDKDDWKWIYEEADLMDLQEADDDIKNIFIKTLSEDYKRLTPSEMYQEVKCEDDEKDNLLDNWIKILLKRLVIYAEFHETPNGEFIFINARIKDIVKERTGQTISCKSFASILGCKYTNYTYKKKTKKGFRIPTDKFIDLFY